MPRQSGHPLVQSTTTTTTTTNNIAFPWGTSIAWSRHVTLVFLCGAASLSWSTAGAWTTVGRSSSSAAAAAAVDRYPRVGTPSSRRSLARGTTTPAATNQMDDADKVVVPAAAVAAAAPASLDEKNDNNNDDTPVWDPVQQIYVGGNVPDTGNQVQGLIQDSGGYLRLFGYGSLCWKPGGLLAQAAVRHTTGRALGYQRCWCQKSTDHRGVPPFPGIVCTILHEDEVRRLVSLSDHFTEAGRRRPSTAVSTEGVVYTVPPELVQDCLDELDFREKGGYAREVIDVVLDPENHNDNETEEPPVVVRVALYRGTPDNPALWPRALRDHVYAAAVMSVAVGDSGANTEYLHNLAHFLEEHLDHPGTAKEAVACFEPGDATLSLARLVDSFLDAQTQFFFLYGCGSNQHNQLLLGHYQRYLVHHGEEAHALTEVLVGAPPTTSCAPDGPAALFAGGGHSALLTRQGRLFLFGWNDMGQCGEYSHSNTHQHATGHQSTHQDDGSPPFRVWEFPYPVHACALGFAHTLAIDNQGTVWALGDNTKGQVSGSCEKNSPRSFRLPITPTPLQGRTVVAVAAGLFHSAAVTSEGIVVTWGGSDASDKDGQTSHFQWTPPQGQKAVGVACGRKFTIAWLDDGTIWSWGSDNKYGQLGRHGSGGSVEATQVSLPWDATDYRICDIQTGWSHVVVLLEDSQTFERTMYGWGRNDKGQLGLGHYDMVRQPTRIDCGTSPHAMSCGSEFTVVAASDGNLWACGWNEHGNLGYATSDDDCSCEWQPLSHARLVQPPRTTTTTSCSPETAFPVCVAAGGSHFLAARTVAGTIETG